MTMKDDDDEEFANVVRSGAAHSVNVSEYTGNAKTPKNIVKSGEEANDIASKNAADSAAAPRSQARQAKERERAPEMRQVSATPPAEAAVSARDETLKGKPNVQTVAPADASRPNLQKAGAANPELNLQRVESEAGRVENRQNIQGDALQDNRQATGEVSARQDNHQGLEQKALLDNRQGVAADQLQDNHQGLGQEALHDNRQGFATDKLQDNHQGLGQEALHDNRQGVATDKLQDNHQGLGQEALHDNRQGVATDKLQDNHQGLGQEALHDNRQGVATDKLQDNPQGLGQEVLEDHRQALEKDPLAANSQGLGRDALHDNRQGLGQDALHDNRQGIDPLAGFDAASAPPDGGPAAAHLGPAHGHTNAPNLQGVDGAPAGALAEGPAIHKALTEDHVGEASTLESHTATTAKVALQDNLQKAPEPAPPEANTPGVAKKVLTDHLEALPDTRVERTAPVLPGAVSPNSVTVSPARAGKRGAARASAAPTAPAAPAPAHRPAMSMEEFHGRLAGIKHNVDALNDRLSDLEAEMQRHPGPASKPGKRGP